MIRTKPKPKTQTTAINREKKLTSTVEQPVQCRSSMPTTNGGEEAQTSNEEEPPTAQPRKMTRRRREEKWWRNEEKWRGARTKRVKRKDGCMHNF